MKTGRTTLIRWIIAGSGILVTLILLAGPTFVLPEAAPEHLPVEAPQRATAVFVLCLALWVSNVIPLPATSLLAVALLGILNVVPSSKAFAYFGNHAVFFILGVFMLSSAMIDTGLSKRLTLHFMHRFDKSPKRLVGGVLICGSFFSLWMPEHAVAAMMYPLVLEVCESMQLKRPGSAYARALFLALAWGTIIGGVGTYLGGARAVLAVELLQKFTDTPVPSFFAFAKMTMPTVVIMTVIAYYLITCRASFEISSITQVTRMLSRRVAELGPMTAREKRLAFLMGVTILAWVALPTVSRSLLGYTIGLGEIALAGGVAVFVLRISQWKRVQDFVNWGVLMMYGGAVALGYAVAETHAMEYFADALVPVIGGNRYIFIIATAAIAILLTESISNAAVVTLMLPVVFSLSGAMDISPLMMMYMVTVPAGLAFCLPMSSPPNAIAYSSGYYGMGAMIRRGMWLNLASLIVFLIVARFYWPLVSGLEF